MKFAYTIVYVDSVEASLAFFERAFGLARRFLHESGSYGELETGATALAFVDHATAREHVGSDYIAAGRSALPLGTEIAFVTEDVAAAVERAVQAGARLINPAKTMPWGQTVAYVRTPDGCLVELCTAMS